MSCKTIGFHVVTPISMKNMSSLKKSDAAKNKMESRLEQWLACYEQFIKMIELLYAMSPHCHVLS